MELWAVIPVKPFARGKSRLASLLGAPERAALNRRLFGRVLEAVLGVFRPERIAVVTGDKLLLALIRGQGLHALEDSGAGLNAALGIACRHVIGCGGDAIAVLPSDLPTVTSADIATLSAALGPAPSCVIAPDEQEQGTNALVLAPPDHDFFRFGPEQLSGPSGGRQTARHGSAHPAPAGARP